MGYKAAIGISNKHLHLSEKDIETLFGKGHKLTPKIGRASCRERV